MQQKRDQDNEALAAMLNVLCSQAIRIARVLSGQTQQDMSVTLGLAVHVIKSLESGNAISAFQALSEKERAAVFEMVTDVSITKRRAIELHRLGASLSSNQHEALREFLRCFKQ